MTRLEDKSVRDRRGLDTLERALVYSALVLRASNTHPLNVTDPGSRGNKYKNAVRVAANFTPVTAAGVEPTLSLSFKFPYDSQESLLRGGVFVEHVKEFGNTPVEILIEVESTFKNNLSFPPEPVWASTLERYAVWIANALITGHTNLASSKAPPVSVNFLEEDSNEPSIIIAAVLKLDYGIYLSTNSLVAAVMQQVPVPQEKEAPVIASNSQVAIGVP